MLKTKSRPLCFGIRAGRNLIGLIIIIIGCLSLFLSQTSWASDYNDQGEGKAQNVHDIGRIVVTDHDKKEVKGITIEPGLTSIDLDTYDIPKSQKTVQDILETIPGIDMQRSDFSQSSDRDVVKIRGFGGRRIMVRIDGRPIRNSGGFGDTLLDWTSLSLENIERIDVMRGAHSAVYGETIGGTINIITKKRGTRNDLKPDISLETDYSSYNTQLYTARATGNANALGYSLAGGYRSSDGFLRNSDYDIIDFTGRLSYLFPFEGQLSIGYKVSDQDKNIFVINDPSRPDYDSSYPVVPAEAFSTVYYPGGDNNSESKTEYFDLIFEQPTMIGNWVLHLYKSNENRNNIYYQYSAMSGSYYDYVWNIDFDDYGWIIQDRITMFDKHHVTIGFDGKNSYGEYYLHSPSRTSKDDRTKRIEHRAGYIEDSWQITEALNFTLGLRYDYADLNFSAFQGDMDEWCPKSALSWEFIQGTTGFINISKAFRVPTWMEYGWMGFPTGENLENETAMEYEAGILHELGENNTFRLTYYYHDVDNYIVFNEALNPRAAQAAGRPLSDSLFNADYLILQGVEVELYFKILEQLDGYINYTFQDYELGSIPVPEDEARIDVHQLPRNKANAGLDWSPWENTTFMTILRYVGERKTSLNEKIDSFFTTDIGVEQCFMSKSLKVKGYINNLFDEEYEEAYLIPAPDRTFGINVSYTF